jgi:hypothetical protein
LPVSLLQEETSLVAQAFLPVVGQAFLPVFDSAAAPEPVILPMRLRLTIHSSPHPLRDRLWLGGIGVLLFLATMIVGSHLAGPRASLIAAPMGEDLIPSYMAGVFVREHRPDKLMDFAEAKRFQADLRQKEGLVRHGRTGPWLNPPFYAWLFVPLAGMSYHPALHVWMGLNGLLLAGSIVLLCRILLADDEHRPDWRVWGLVPLLVVISMPCLQTLASQQNTFWSLAILCGAVVLWRAGRAFTAGAVAGLLLFKPQLAAVVAVAMACSLGRRAVLGWLATGAALLVITVTTLPGTLGDYLHRLPENLPWLQPGITYHWERQATFQGFWRMLLQGPVSGPAPLAVRLIWPTCAALVAGPLGLVLGRTWRGRIAAASPDRLIAATVAAMPLVMPYYMDYDLLLLSVAAVLFAADVRRGGGAMTRLDRWIVAGWMLLFPWLYLNPFVAFDTRVSLTVPLLATLSGLLIVWAGRASAVGSNVPRAEPAALLEMAA